MANDCARQQIAAEVRAFAACVALDPTLAEIIDPAQMYFIARHIEQDNVRPFITSYAKELVL